LVLVITSMYAHSAKEVEKVIRIWQRIFTLDFYLGAK
jgi:hypothetical protein